MHDAYRQLGQKVLKRSPEMNCWILSFQGFEKFSDEFKHFHEFYPPRPFPVRYHDDEMTSKDEDDDDAGDGNEAFYDDSEKWFLGWQGWKF